MSIARQLRRKAKAIQGTYVGQHWPDARTMNINGVGIDFGEREPGGAKVRAYLAACHPELLLAALDELAARPPETPGLREAARAYLDAEAEPAYSWVLESQEARAEGRPNREVERMDRIARARVVLEEALAARPPETPGPRCDFDCWECSEKAADADIAAGRVTTYDSFEEFAADVLAVRPPEPSDLDVEPADG